MFPDTKIILCSVLALAIGIASVVPLAFFMYEESNKPHVDVEAILGDQSPLNFNLTYAYIGDYWNNNSNINDGNYGWKVCINYRTVPNIDVNAFSLNQSFAAYEYYTLEVSSETGVIASTVFYSNTYSKSNSSLELIFGHQPWFNYNSSEAVGGIYPSGTFAPGLPGLYQSSTAIFQNGTAHGQLLGSANNWNISAGKPETMFLTVRRLGWVILNDNNTTVHYANSELVAQMQLHTYGDGFMYNKLFTQNELSQINPVMPQFKFMR